MILGLTGNIAAGKSTVARALARRGALVVDAISWRAMSLSLVVRCWRNLCTLRSADSAIGRQFESRVAGPIGFCR